MKATKKPEKQIVKKQEVEAVVPTVESFIEKAITANLPVETMERFFALRKEMKAEAAAEAFTVAMSNFQSECPVIEKRKAVYEKNSQQVRYKFAPLDSIVEQVKPYLGKNGLSYTIDVLNEPDFLSAICKITHVQGHFETSTFRVPVGSEQYMSDVQKYGARLTFAKRYAFCNALGILTGDEDTDATEAPKVAAKATQDPFVIAKEMINRAKSVPVLNDCWKKISNSPKYTPAQKETIEGIIAARVEEITSNQPA